MNRFEQAVYDCMIPTAELLENTSDPLHRAMLLNFWRHVHLEGAGEYEQIVASDMMVDEPVYRVTWGAAPGRHHRQGRGAGVLHQRRRVRAVALG
jgi:hypothetical protein